MLTRDSRPWRTVFSRTAWSSACRALLFESGRWAAGSAAWNTTSEARELLVGRLAVEDQLPHGSTRAPLADWVAIGMSASLAELSSLGLRRIEERIEPRPLQLLAVLMLDGSDRRHWNSAVFHGDSVLAVEEVRIVGAGMLRLTREPASEMETVSTRGRWSRTVGSVGPAVWRRINSSTATLIGAGRNGSQLAFQLAGIGIGRLRIVDPGALGEENLDAMPGLSANDLGQPRSKRWASDYVNCAPI